MKHKLFQKATCLLLCTAALASCLWGCKTPRPATAEYSDTGTYFDTIIRITLYDPNQTDLIQDCFQMAAHYEGLFSRTLEDSDVSRINQNPGTYVTVDPETIDLIETGLEYCQKTDGIFDITVGALSDLWDIRNNPGVIPEEKEIQKAVDSIGWDAIHINENQVMIAREGTLLDLGAIAKGYIADRMKEYLADQGVTSATINLGGNVLVIGTKPDGKNYNIGIQKPFDKTNSTAGAVSIADQTVVSSGNYERYFELNGKIYHHIMDTATGFPVDNDLTSVSIICKNSVDGDALSTTCYSLGLKKGLEFIETLDETEAIFLTKDGTIHCSSGIGTKIKFKETTAQ